MANIGIKVNKKSNLFEALLYYFQNEQIDYEIAKENYNYETVIFLGINIDEIKNSIKSSAIIISDKEEFIEGNEYPINYIITNLVNDNTDYTEVQKEYLFKKGIYSILLQKVSELIVNENDYDGLIYNLTKIKTQPYNWMFQFESINETYAWLSRMNKSISQNFVQKIVNFYSDKMYDDSVREINYLSDKLMNIKNNKHMIDIFILNNEEFKIMKENYFFKSLLNNISDNYSIYLVYKDDIMANDRDLLNKLLDGVCIYENCVYRDTYDDEFSLGYVDCKEETVQEYNKYFDYLLDKYGKKVKMDGELDV